jgi:hypothetical protein
MLYFQFSFLALQEDSVYQMFTQLSHLCEIQTAADPVQYFIALGEIGLQFFQSCVVHLNDHQHSDNLLINQRLHSYLEHSGSKIL